MKEYILTEEDLSGMQLSLIDSFKVLKTAVIVLGDLIQVIDTVIEEKE